MSKQSPPYLFGDLGFSGPSSSVQFSFRFHSDEFLCGVDLRRHGGGTDFHSGCQTQRLALCCILGAATR